jgi:hypothetical protein
MKTLRILVIGAIGLAAAASTGLGTDDPPAPGTASCGRPAE